MPKISVIVAVYNAEKYLKRCLESLASQSFDDFEVLLVDDGAEDCSGDICEEFASNDCRFRVFHKKNGGVSSARQLGLDESLGEYIIHVDPDDWVDSTMLEEMLEFSSRNCSDVVICDYYSHTPEGVQVVLQKPQNIDSASIAWELFDRLDGYCWNKLVKKSCMTQNRISFLPNMVVWEDLFICLSLFMHPCKVSYFSKAFYHYDRMSNENRITRTASRKKLDSMLFFIDYFEKKMPASKLSLLNRHKIEAKRTAFLLNDMSKKEFYDIYPDSKKLFVEKFEGYRKVDGLIRFALTCSWNVARIACKLWLWQQKRRFY